MIELRNKRVLVVGLARSGRAVAHRLSREGAVVTVTDSRPPSSFDFGLKELMAQRIGLELGVHREETFLNQDLIVVSPGVPWDIPQLELARRRRVPAVPEIEAASWFFSGTLVGITGTNGKTTTTTVLGKMLEASGFSSLVAGNIGVPLISAVELYPPKSIVVAELSSFQLEAIESFRPHIAVLLNITANHLDRHHTFEGYVAAKAQIFRNQQAADYAILNADDPVVMSLAPAIASQKVFFSTEQDLPEGVLLSRGRILYRVSHLERVLFEEQEIKLRGRFNTQNMMAAAAAACTLGADFKAIREVAREFTGVEHRLEFVASVRGVSFYNDSKATSVDAAAKALSTFDRGVHLILGGKDKGAPYAPLKTLMEGRVKFVYLIGSAAEKIAGELGGSNLVMAGDLKTAVRMAFARAITGDVVLLSPACSSYDQFEDFEARGRMFKETVQHLDKAAAYKAYPAARVELAPESRPGAGGQTFYTEPRAAAAASDSELGAKRVSESTPEKMPLAPAATPIETPSELTVEPVYVYEVSGEEMAPPPADEFRPPALDEPAEPALLIEDTEPVSPYEVTGAGESSPKGETISNLSEVATESPSVASAPFRSRTKRTDALAGTQADLFFQEQPEKPFDKGK